MPVWFSKRNAKRIAEQTEKAERRPVELKLKEVTRKASNAQAFSVGYTKTSITARSSATPGYGTVYLKTRNSTTGLLEGTDEITAYNPFRESIDAGVWVQVSFNEVWWLSAADCDEVTEA